MTAPDLTRAAARARDDILWCCYVLGPDDVIPAPDYDTARTWADRFNRVFAYRHDRHENEPDMRAFPAPWPWSAERHAEGVTDEYAWLRDTSDEAVAEMAGRFRGARIRALEARLSTLEAEAKGREEENERLREAVKLVRSLISEAAATGFNCHDGDWAERLFASQAITRAAHAGSAGR